RVIECALHLPVVVRLAQRHRQIKLTRAKHPIERIDHRRANIQCRKKEQTTRSERDERQRETRPTAEAVANRKRQGTKRTHSRQRTIEPTAAEPRLAQTKVRKRNANRCSCAFPNRISRRK